MNRVLRLLRPSHQHTAFSATLLLMTAVLLSRVIGYIREAYIAWAFGAGPATDAYVAGFTIPDWLNYLVAGGTASITFVSIYTRFLAENREEDAQKTFSVIITVIWRPGRQFSWAVLSECDRRGANWNRLQPLLRCAQSCIPGMGALVDSTHARRFSCYCRRLDSPLLRIRGRRRYHTSQLCQALVRCPYRSSGAGHQPSLVAVFRQAFRGKAHAGVCGNREWINLPHYRHFSPSHSSNDGYSAAADRPRLPPWAL